MKIQVIPPQLPKLAVKAPKLPAVAAPKLPALKIPPPSGALPPGMTGRVITATTMIGALTFTAGLMIGLYLNIDMLIGPDKAGGLIPAPAPVAGSSKAGKAGSVPDAAPPVAAATAAPASTPAAVPEAAPPAPPTASPSGQHQAEALEPAPAESAPAPAPASPTSAIETQPRPAVARAPLPLAPYSPPVTPDGEKAADIPVPPDAQRMEAVFAQRDLLRGVADGVPAYAVQMAVFRELGNAKGMVKDLDSRGFPATLHTDQGDSGVWYTVTVGRYPVREEADRMRTRLQSEVGLAGIVMLVLPKPPAPESTAE